MPLTWPCNPPAEAHNRTDVGPLGVRAGHCVRMSSRSVACIKHGKPNTHMQKTFTTILLLSSAVAAFAQGTINFQNSFLTPITLRVHYADGTFSSSAVPTTPGLVDYGVFYGTSAGSLTLASPLIPNSTAAAGLVAAPTTAFAIPGSNPGDTTWFIQVKGWSATYGTDWQTAQTDFSSHAGIIWGTSSIAGGFALGPAAGPGYAIWQDRYGTNPAKIGAFTLYENLLIPEPSTMALLSSGVVAVLIFRRRK